MEEDENTNMIQCLDCGQTFENLEIEECPECGSTMIRVVAEDDNELCELEF